MMRGYGMWLLGHHSSDTRQGVRRIRRPTDDSGLPFVASPRRQTESVPADTHAGS